MAAFGTQAFSGTKMGHIANSTTQVNINKSGISQQDNAAISCHKNLEKQTLNLRLSSLPALSNCSTKIPLEEMPRAVLIQNKSTKNKNKKTMLNK